MIACRIAGPAVLAAANGWRKSVMRFLLLFLTMVAVSIQATVPQAMPLDHSAYSGRTLVPAADGCGFNRYRDARGICRYKYVFRPHQGKRPYYSGCSGTNSHRVCNLQGQCWTECD
jgi:hypothetical protein